MTIASPSRCGPRTAKGSGWRAPASASKSAWAATVCDYPSAVRQHGIDVRGDQPREILHRTIQGDDLAESRSADRQVPAIAALRSEHGQLPLLESGTPALDRRLDGGVQARSRAGIGELRANNAHRHRV